MRRRTRSRPKNSEKGSSQPSFSYRPSIVENKKPYVVKKCKVCGTPYVLGPLDPDTKICPICFASGIGLVRTSEPPEIKSSQDPRWYITGKSDALVSTRNRKILQLLNLEGASTVNELSQRMNLKPSTIEVEMKYLESKNLVKKV